MTCKKRLCSTQVSGVGTCMSRCSPRLAGRALTPPRVLPVRQACAAPASVKTVGYSSVPTMGDDKVRCCQSSRPKSEPRAHVNGSRATRAATASLAAWLHLRSLVAPYPRDVTRANTNG